MEAEIMELSPSYLNTLAKQFMFVCAFLGGFSATILSTLISSEIKNKYSKIMIVSSALSAMCFVVTLFGMTSILFQTTEGYPIPIDESRILIIRIISLVSLLIGILSFAVCVASSGWLVSKRIGRFTSMLGVIGLILIFLMM